MKLGFNSSDKLFTHPPTAIVFDAVIVYKALPKESPQSSPFAHFIAAQLQLGWTQLVQRSHVPYDLALVALLDTQH